MKRTWKHPARTPWVRISFFFCNEFTVIQPQTNPTQPTCFKDSSGRNPVFYVTPKTSIVEVLETMTKEKVRRLAVCEEEDTRHSNITHIVTQSDVFAQIATHAKELYPEGYLQKKIGDLKVCVCVCVCQAFCPLPRSSLFLFSLLQRLASRMWRLARLTRPPRMPSGR